MRTYIGKESVGHTHDVVARSTTGARATAATDEGVERCDGDLTSRDGRGR